MVRSGNGATIYQLCDFFAYSVFINDRQITDPFRIDKIFYLSRILREVSEGFLID